MLNHLFILYFSALMFASLSFSFYPGNLFGADYEQVAGVLDTRSQFSDGVYTIDGLAKMAQDRGIKVLFINDHDKTALSYGIPPFPNILNKTVEMKSILQENPEDYLQAIRHAQERYKDVIIIPGSESAPFYFWTGNPLKNNMTAHDHERRILTVGLSKADDYRRLPVLHNTSALNMELMPPLLPFLFAFVLAAFLIIWRGWLRITGIVLAVISLLFIVDNHPFRASPFDPFHGNQGIAPYQGLIDYVHARGGLTFWNYPETQSGVRKLGPIQVSTKPYPAMLMETSGYTGFAALYAETSTITEPGNIWDMALKEYCQGYRPQPPWGVATADYHKEGESGEKFGNYQTVFLVHEKTSSAVLKAMETGKMYARQGAFPKLPILNEFSVAATTDGQQRGFAGDKIIVNGHPRIRIAVSAPSLTAAGPITTTMTPPATTSNTHTSISPTASMTTPLPATGGGSPAVKVRLIRNGALIQTFSGPLPLTVDYEDPYYQPGEKIYYRMDMEGAGKIVSNPIFVTFSGEKP